MAIYAGRFSGEKMLRPALITAAIIFSSLVLGLAVLAGNSNLPEENIASPAQFQPGVATHETKTEWQPTLESANASEAAAELEAVPSAPPTRSGFMANWAKMSPANGYLLDVSASESFDG